MKSDWSPRRRVKGEWDQTAESAFAEIAVALVKPGKDD